MSPTDSPIAEAFQVHKEIVDEAIKSINAKLDVITEAIKQLESQQQELKQHLQSLPEGLTLSPKSSIQEGG